QVAQIARTIARALNLNEDLTEAIALGHDLGHPPFGHAGEQALAELLPEGFRHAEQSLRVVEKLERLNLTWEVRDGIVNSSKIRGDILAEGFGTPATLEGQIVKLADAVAYINHDITDAIRADLIHEEDLPPHVAETLGRSHSQRIDTLVCGIIEESWAATGDDTGPSAESGEAIRIAMSPPALTAANALREFMFQRVYLWEGRREESERAMQVVRALYGHYVEHPEEIQSDFVIAADPPWRRAADYVAGMTDRFAVAALEKLQQH
ncbi:MAG: HD domain-containing protein, partial [Dehalococcoidia bacterium]